MSILELIHNGRITCMNANEEPRYVLISKQVKEIFRDEVLFTSNFLVTATQDQTCEIVYGMYIEWVDSPTPVSIRTAKGDVYRCQN